MSGQINQSDAKLLALRSGNVCAFAGCRRALSHDGDQSKDAVLGEMAHIVGEKDGSARYDSTYPKSDLNKYDNLMFLCPTCHTTIDKQEQDYPIALLIRVKKDHEDWVQASLEQAMTSITFTELDEVAQSLLDSAGPANDEFSVTLPSQKLGKNGLTGKIKHTLMLGIAKASEVGEFISSKSVVDANFGDRLRAGFLKEYYRLVHEDGLHGDDLFNALCLYASGRSSDFGKQSAGIAALAYLFEKCEVFDR